MCNCTPYFFLIIIVPSFLLDENKMIYKIKFAIKYAKTHI